METLVNKNNVIDTPIEMLILILICLAGIIILFKIGNFLESLPVSEKKKTVKQKKIEVTKEVDESVSSKTKATTDKSSKKNKNYVIEKEYDDSKSKSSSSKESEKNISINNEVYASKSSVGVVVDSSASTQSTSGNFVQSGHACPYASSGAYMMQAPMMYNPATMDNPYADNYLYDRFSANPTMDDYVEDKQLSEAFLSDNDLQQVQSYTPNIKVGNVETLDKKASLHQRISQMTSSNSDKRERLLKEFEGLSKEMKLLIIDNIIQKM